ncbi:hypothetical protein PV10_07044 [Exophiala mesophila]|uniref:RNA polymerase II subunit B1 CTD phosphatase RPAP2 homolog n=1 Tax=Exophiala mesophila TaxID=212818 RepID=A0A0D1Z6Y2_EXOME|nr:uncharacterized protein PV10_07044 [Exophiala mesophila]KIV89659.1 hypothetical protein PV10_07044 [Exophiala mesophila]
MAGAKSKDETDSRIRAAALKQAHDIEGRKRLKAKIADLIVDAYDLPSKPDVDPAHPISADATLFKQCLSLWQPSDLEDLIYERNVDDRCGYALCPKPNQKVQGGGVKVWNRKGGKEFKLLDKAELEKWCSTACQERTMFVRAQLGNEPAWLRDVSPVDIKLLDEMGQNESLVDSLQALSMSPGVDDGMAEKLQALALERGASSIPDDKKPLSIVERESGATPAAPSLGNSSNLVEGHRPKNVRFQHS